ncbi:MAG: hypothetical protein JOY83_19440 [Alphaproteobacteria bacterium]|nr:hypothetical protein [Alphaproteobacteria bacterium]
MVTSTTTRESDFLQTLIPGYEAEGFSVFLRPTRKMLPPFMRGYQPDAIAIKDEKKIAIEIKRDAARHAARIEQLQQTFLKHPEWELRIYYIPGRPGEEDIQTLNLSEIDAALAEVDQLKRAGHFRAALIMAFAALEAAGRALLPRDLARPQPANKLVEVLASEGAVTPAEAESLRSAIGLRNSIAHGGFSLPVTEQEVEQVVATARMIIGLAKEPSSSQER